MPVLTLRCRDCGLPFARVQNGAILIESHHHGERHVNTIAVSELVKMVEAAAEPVLSERDWITVPPR